MNLDKFLDNLKKEADHARDMGKAYGVSDEAAVQCDILAALVDVAKAADTMSSEHMSNCGCAVCYALADLAKLAEAT